MYLGVWLCLSAVLAAEPKGVPLLAGEAWYQEAKEPETVFEGVVERNSGSGRVGPPTRFNAYRLSWIDSAGHPGGRDLYLPGKAQVLAPYLGQRIRVVGKAVDTEADGTTHHELWPAHLEVPGAAVTAPAPAGKVEGVYARCYWRPESGLYREPRVRVFRSGEQLAPYLRVSGSNADEAATALLARRLNVASIDWKQQMVVSVSAGLLGRDADRLTITRAVVKEGVLIVTYRLESSPGGAGGIGFPAETVLVDHFDGEVRLEADTSGK